MSVEKELFEDDWADEIEEYRLAYGDEVLYLLYEHVVGKPYSGSTGSRGKGSVANERTGAKSKISKAASDALVHTGPLLL